MFTLYENMLFKMSGLSFQEFQIDDHVSPL